MMGSIWLEGFVTQKSQSDERDAMEAAITVATEAVVSIRTVQSLGIESLFLEKFKTALDDSCRAVAKKTRWRGLVLGLGIYVPFLSYCGATIYGTYLVAREGLDFKIVLLVNEAVMYGAYMLGQSLVCAPSFNSAKVCGAKILAIINRQPKVRTKDGFEDKRDWSATGNFTVKDVEFCYPTRPNQRVLKGMDLKVEAGQTCALVGSSGCGKSTVLQLLQRFYDPDTGNIVRVRSDAIQRHLVDLIVYDAVDNILPGNFIVVLRRNINYTTRNMGQILGTWRTSGIGLKMNDKPTFDTNVGFSSKRQQRKMVACEEDLISARVPPQYRDYCAHLLMNYLVCRYKNIPFLYRCHHEKHLYLNCEHEDYVIRMKEFERERRLREREQRLKEGAGK